MSYLKRLLLFINVILFTCNIQLSALGIYSAGKRDTTNNHQKVIKEQNGQITDNSDGISFTGFPLILYMPETSMILGGGGVITIRDGNGKYSNRPNSISFRAIYTFKNQLGFSVSPDFYFDNYKWKINATVAYQKFPDLFYGIGNVNSEDDAEAYSTEEYLFVFGVTRRIFENFSFGFYYNIQRINVLEIQKDGKLASGEFYGVNGGLLSGMGPVIDWDSRDNIFYPTKGFWLHLYAGLYDKRIGSHFDNSIYSVDFRYYINLLNSQVLAIQLLGSSVAGDIPFNEYSKLKAMRGVNGNRFRDKKMFMTQIEYRFPLYGRFSGVAFGAIGDVTDKIQNIAIHNLKYSFGVGLRFSVNPDEKINFRFDVGFSPWGISPYFQITEAF